MHALRRHREHRLLGSVAVILLAATATRSAVLKTLEREISDVVSSVAPHVVTVRATFPGPAARPPFRPVVNVGSGLLVDSLGYIITASGVVSHFSTVAPSLTVLDRNKHPHEALLYSINPSLRIAVLYAPTLAGTSQPAVRTKRWTTGAFALVVGNSFGVGPSVSLMTVAGRRERDGFWQLSDPATPGYSGAPVFDSDGALGGLIVGEVAGSGADLYERPLPAVMVTNEQLKPVLDRLASRSSPGPHPWLGIAVRPRIAPTGGTSLFVSNVFSNSPAAEAGLRRGDVLLGVDTLTVSYVADLAEWIRRCTPGRAVTIRILRDGQRRTLTVMVGQR